MSQNLGYLQPPPTAPGIGNVPSWDPQDTPNPDFPSHPSPAAASPPPPPPLPPFLGSTSVRSQLLKLRLHPLRTPQHPNFWGPLPRSLPAAEAPPPAPPSGPESARAAAPETAPPAGGGAAPRGPGRSPHQTRPPVTPTRQTPQDPAHFPRTLRGDHANYEPRPPTTPHQAPPPTPPHPKEPRPHKAPLTAEPSVREAEPWAEPRLPRPVRHRLFRTGHAHSGASKHYPRFWAGPCEPRPVEAPPPLHTPGPRPFRGRCRAARRGPLRSRPQPRPSTRPRPLLAPPLSPWLPGVSSGAQGGASRGPGGDTG